MGDDDEMCHIEIAMGVWIGFVCLRIVTGGRFLWTR
jgi:hypothetical protein